MTSTGGLASSYETAQPGDDQPGDFELEGQLDPPFDVFFSADTRKTVAEIQKAEKSQRRRKNKAPTLRIGARIHLYRRYPKALLRRLSVLRCASRTVMRQNSTSPAGVFSDSQSSLPGRSDLQTFRTPSWPGVESSQSGS